MTMTGIQVCDSFDMEEDEKLIDEFSFGGL